MTDAEIDDRLVAQLDRFGADRYGRSSHPLVRKIQDMRLRCVSHCMCAGCVAWRDIADHLLTFVERQPDPPPPPART